MKLSAAIHENTKAILVGFIGGLMLLILWEVRGNIAIVGMSVALIVGAWFLNKKIAHHFHGHHHHVGDSAIDIVAPAVLIVANVLHPAVDSFTFYQTLIYGGIPATIVIGSGIILHEILRQSALIAAFRFVGLRWYVAVLSALVGIGMGITLGILESGIVVRYEAVADLATIFAYAFVISEFIVHKKQGTQSPRAGIALGVCIALMLHLFMASV